MPPSFPRQRTCSISAGASTYLIALEGALKFKEIFSYIHAEGYAAGELKHGPMALIDENVPVIVIAPEDDLFDNTISALQEVAARGGQPSSCHTPRPARLPAKYARTFACRMCNRSPIR